MRRTECVREAAVVEALLAPGGLAQAEAGLNEHVRTCGTCASVVEAASAVLDDERAAVAAARVPSAATVWWRVQLRARREAETRATRPIVVWQGLAAACGLGVLAAAVGFPRLATARRLCLRRTRARR